MGKFCKYCGKSLEENEICSCQQETKQSQERPASISISVNIDTKKMKAYVIRLGDCLISGIKQPITTVENMIKNRSFDLALGLLGLSLIMTMILISILYSKLLNWADILMLENVLTIEYNFGFVLKLTLFINCLPMLIFSMFVLIVGLIKNKTINIKDIIIICGATHLIIIYTQIISLLGLFIKSLFIPILLAGNMMGLILAYIGMREVYQLNKDTSFWMTALCSLFSILTYLLIVNELLINR